jgi:hypothetical protein
LWPDWSYTQIFFLAGFTGKRVLNKNLKVWLIFQSLIMNLAKSQFDKLITYILLFLNLISRKILIHLATLQL